MTDQPADHEFRSSDRPYTCRICGENIREHTLTDEVRAYLDRPAEPWVEMTELERTQRGIQKADGQPVWVCDVCGWWISSSFKKELTSRQAKHVALAHATKDEADEEPAPPKGAPPVPDFVEDSVFLLPPKSSRSVVRRLVAQGASDVLIEELETLRKENASLVERLRVAEAEREQWRKLAQDNWELYELRTPIIERLRQQVASLEVTIAQLRILMVPRDQAIAETKRILQETTNALYADRDGLVNQVASLEEQLRLTTEGRREPV